MKKYLIYILIPVFFTAGMLTEKFTQNPPVLSCPECPSCPDAVLQVQSLDLNDLRRIRGGFTFAPTYEGTIVLCDSIPQPQHK